ncbi:MAG: hemolysin family protein [Treponema sp.]|jgi:CBS domain containing-hemolysin-like protein|nr:hemolysin family protein [Treponema sp.]
MESKPPPADTFSIPLLLLVAAALIVFSLLFSAAESAFLSLNKLRVRFLRERRDRRAERAGKLLDKKELLLNTLLVSNALVNILLSALLTAAALKFFGPAGVGIATFVVTLILLVFGEITPKTIATRYPEKVAFGLSLFISYVSVVMRPIVIVFTAVSRFVLGFSGIRMNKPHQTFTEEEIKTYIDAGGDEGVLASGEKNMMRRVFKFKDLEAQDIMVPRKSIVAVPFNASYREILELSERTRFSCFPVFKKDIDDIIGILYVKDLLFYTGPQYEFSVQNIMRPPLFVSGIKKMSSIQQMFHDNRQSLAVVIDEYSGTDGLLTRKDISRELFGSVGSGTSRSGRTVLEHIKNPADCTVPGSVLLMDVSDLLGVMLESRINETLGGWIAEKLNHIPEAGESVKFGGWLFTVKKMSGMVVSEIRICTAAASEVREL